MPQTQEMEVKNPLFQDDPTPATPAPGLGAEAGQDGIPEGGKAAGRVAAAAGRASASKMTTSKPADDNKELKSKSSSKSDIGKP